MSRPSSRGDSSFAASLSNVATASRIVAVVEDRRKAPARSLSSSARASKSAQSLPRHGRLRARTVIEGAVQLPSVGKPR
jgi:hypothetical protein